MTLTPSHFEARRSDDPVKTDLELTCTACESVLCDVEHGDSIEVLLSVAEGHVCMDTAAAPGAGVEATHDGHWILVEREHSPSLHVGPYPSLAAADHAQCHALLIDGFTEDDATDVQVLTDRTEPADAVTVLIDLADPDHTGVGSDDDAGDIAAAIAHARVTGSVGATYNGVAVTRAHTLALGQTVVRPDGRPTVVTGIAVPRDRYSLPTGEDVTVWTAEGEPLTLAPNDFLRTL
ncbi:hypothetical protein ACFQ80_20375 [Isoptericola sp. NPDC056578]|uniref:hypothetical protein n=1 Tax=Isoptericola sp. NPDC056578 TaxID=3345870 RepID=UPI0036B65816